VAFVISRLGVGGAEAQLIELVNGLDPLGIEPWLVCLNDFGELADRLLLPREKMIALGFTNGRDPRVIQSALSAGAAENQSLILYIRLSEHDGES
jgi:hypothetical protein